MPRSSFPWDKERAGDKEGKEKLLQQVYEYTVGNSSKNITPKTRKEIAKLMNRTPQWVWLQWNELVKRGKLQKNPDTGYLVKSEKEKVAQRYEQVIKSEFAQIGSVSKWIGVMQTAGKGGKPLVAWSGKVAALNVMCNTLSVHPDAFLQDIDTSTNLLTEFEKKLRAGEVKYTQQFKVALNFAIIDIIGYKKALRNFMYRNNVALPRGMSGIMSGKKERFGAYANLKLNDREFEKGLNFMHGYGFEELFGIGNETFPRTNTLLHLTNKFELRPLDVKGVVAEYGIMQVYESKTSRAFPKIVVHPRILEIIKRVPKGEPFSKVRVTTTTQQQNLLNEFTDALTEFYISLGKIDRSHYIPNAINTQQWSYEKGTEEWYWGSKPAYCLRHDGAHRAMRRTGNNATIVAAMGWDDVATLLKVYAQTNEDAIMMQNICLFHNPPKTIDPIYDYFCSYPCALGYYSNGCKPAPNVQLQEVRTVA